MKKLNNQKNQSILNQARVLHEICSNSPITRTDIAKRTNLTSMTITNIVNKLITEGLVVEMANIKGDTQFGRKPSLLDISSSSPCVIGINFTRKTIHAVLSDYKLNILVKKSASIGVLEDPVDFLNLVLNITNEIIKSTVRKIIGIGISSFGPLDIDNGLILSTQNFYNFKNIPIVDFIHSNTNLPIYFIHDSNAAAIAENLYGATNGQDFLFLRIASGVGSGLLLNNQIHNGNMGMSGEIGHVSINMNGPLCECGNRGCLENYINTETFANLINEKHNFNPSLSWEDIVTLYNSKQNLFSDFFEDYCHYIAFSCINIVNLLDIHLIILEYRGQNSGDNIEKLVETYINRSVLANNKRYVTVSKSLLNNDAALFGAVSVVLSKIFLGEIDYQ